MALDVERFDIAPSPKGSKLRVRVKPAARRNAFEREHMGALKISVSAAPERGKANRAVEELLAEALGVPRSSVSVVAGAGSRDKLVEVRGLGPDEVRKRLALRLVQEPGPPKT